METLYSLTIQYISVPYLVCFILLSYGLRDITSALVCKLLPNVKSEVRYGVFIIAVILCIPFYLFWETNVLKLLITYCVGTSLYELIIDALVNFIKAKLKQTS